MRQTSDVLLLLIACAVPGLWSALVQSRCPSPCVLTRECPAAVALLRDISDEEAVRQLRDAYCSHRDDDDVEVCCEKLKEVEDICNRRGGAQRPHFCFHMESRCPSRCVLTRECPAAVALLRDISDEEAVRLLQYAYCRHRDDDDVEVCCEMLQEPKPVEDVSKHRSVALLPESCGYSEVARIFGGQEAAIFEFPWMAHISYNINSVFAEDELLFRCAGSLINSRYVLTAAHCVKGLQIAGVRLGDHDTWTQVDCQGAQPYRVCENFIQDKEVEKVIVHPGYRRLPSIRNDIALLRFKSPADTTPKNVRPICLPLTKEQISRNLTGANSTIAGWGATKAELFSPVLLKVHVPIHSQEACRGYYNRGLRVNAEDETLNKLCAGELHRGSCGGDSGGPLMLPEPGGDDTKYTQYGIVSYGHKDCGSLIPDVYTDVRRYVTWILDNIEP